MGVAICPPPPAPWVQFPSAPRPYATSLYPRSRTRPAAACEQQQQQQQSSSRDRDSSSRLENRTEDDMTEDLSFPLCCSFGLVSGGTETPTTHGEQQSKREQGNLTWHLRSPFLVLFDFFFLFCSCWRPKRHRWRLWCMRQAMASFLVPESCVLVMLAAPSV